MVRVGEAEVADVSFPAVLGSVMGCGASGGGVGALDLGPCKTLALAACIGDARESMAALGASLLPLQRSPPLSSCSRYAPRICAATSKPSARCVPS